MNQLHKKFILAETIKSILINIALGCTAVFFATLDFQSVPLSESGGVLANVIPQTFMTVFMSVLIATLITRKLLKSSRVSAIPHEPGKIRSTHFLLRSFSYAAFAMIICIPLLHLLLPLLTDALWSKSMVFMFTAVYAIVLAIIATPLALIRTLQEGILLETFKSDVNMPGG